jgi:GT2 family glycosyltransferase
VSEPDVTLIIVARERFSAARRSLESVIENTSHPHRLVYFQAGAPPALAQWLREQAAIYFFKLREFKTFLHPNYARNLGLDEVDTPFVAFVAFVDNDVIVQPGWLEALVRCAQETSADIVGPATLIGADDSSAVVHLLGGDLIWESEG